jgi:hypothetical protein
MEKLDLKKSLKYLYGPKTGDFAPVEVPPMNFLAIDGIGDPNSAASYKEAVEALFSIAYALKFKSKKSLEKDYAVMPLEALWWADDYGAFINEKRDVWRWTVMIMQPDWITADMAEEARRETAKKKSLPALPLMRFENFAEGECLQMMFVGPYSDEPPVLQRLHDEIMPSRGLTYNGKHHEIYLGDPRKTAPEKLKTVLRQPVRKAQ